MKRNILTLITLVLAALGSAIQAQRPTGDTLTERDLTYFVTPLTYNAFVPPIEDSTLWLSSHDNFFYFGDDQAHYSGNQIIGQQMFTDRPIKVVGLATCAYIQPPTDINMREFSYCFPNTRDTSMTGRATDSLILYTIVDDNPVELKSSPWRAEQPHRYLLLPPYDTTEPIQLRPIPAIASLYETMFDTPVIVEGDFIVAGTELNNEGSYSWIHAPHYEQWPQWIWLWDHCPTRYWYMHGGPWIPVSEARQFPSYVVHWAKQLNSGSSWQRTIAYQNHNIYDTLQNIVYTYAVQWYTQLMFPIIDLSFDTSYCHGVSNLRLAGRSGNNATLMWDSDESGPWEVAYGKASAPRDSFSVVNTSVPTVRLSGFDARTPYHAYVRGYCDLNDSYSDWIGPLEFQVYEGPAQPGDTTAIDQPGSMASFIQLLPNPATSQVQILSSYKMDRIVLFDLGGRTLLDQPADGISSLLDLSALPKGSYIVAIHSAKSIATKKLIVE